MMEPVIERRRITPILLDRRARMRTYLKGIVSCRRALTLVAIVGLLTSGCKLEAAPTPRATVQPELGLVVWVEWPIIQFEYDQIIHVIVQDRFGRRMPGATVRGTLATGTTTRPLYFPVSDSGGYTRLVVPVPSTGPGQVYMIDVWASYEAKLGRGKTSYTAFP